MIISYSNNFIYIHLEKTGGTSIEFALDPTLLSDDIIIGSTPRGEASEGKYGTLWKHSSAQEIKDYLGDQYDHMYKFSTVRDPQEIMISLYYYCEMIISRFIKITDTNLTNFFKNPESSANKFWKTEMPYMFYYHDSYINKTGIDGFIALVLSETSNFKMLSQWERLDTSVEIFDISKISDRWEYLLNKIGTKDIKINVLNKSNRPKNVILSQKTKDLISLWFIKDYENIPNITGVNWI